ncbi:acyl carrier protein [Streptomyces sp. NPDC002659]|uniref:acyl carrier protein n=1 Tax=Streptomyces sp. NPDC002659 TaxID=3364656 RepID=UPI0036C016B5
MGSTPIEIVADCIRESSPLGEAATFELDTHLARTGIIDSLAILSITASLEKRLGLKIPDDLIQPQNFTSLRTLVELVDGLPRLT